MVGKPAFLCVQILLVHFKKTKNNIQKNKNVTHYLLCYIFLTPYISELGTIT